MTRMSLAGSNSGMPLAFNGREDWLDRFRLVVRGDASKRLGRSFQATASGLDSREQSSRPNQALNCVEVPVQRAVAAERPDMLADVLVGCLRARASLERTMKFEALRPAQQFTGEDACRIGYDAAAFARRGRAHGYVVFAVGRSWDGIDTRRECQGLVLGDERRSQHLHQHH